MGGGRQAPGGTCSWVSKEFGLHPKDNVAPQEGLVPVETCPDQGVRELWVPREVSGYQTRGPGLEKEGTEEMEEVGLGFPVCPPDLPWAPDYISGPIPHLLWLPGEFGPRPRSWGISPTPCWAQTSSLPEATAPARCRLPTLSGLWEQPPPRASPTPCTHKEGNGPS